MNRLSMSEDLSSLTRPLYLEPCRVESSQRSSLHYSLFAPLHYEKNYAYPLLVWLHQAGGDERQLQRVMPLISMRNYVGVAPRAPAPEGVAQWRQVPPQIDTAEQFVLEAVDVACHRFNVSPQRIFLAGFNDGGTMAIRLCLRQPHRFAGALTLGGPFPDGETPLRFLEQSRHVPLFVAGTANADAGNMDRVCNDLRLFHAAGMSVTLRQYPGDQDLHPQMLHDMDVWMMEQVTGHSSRADTQADPFWHAN